MYLLILFHKKSLLICAIRLKRPIITICSNIMRTLNFNIRDKYFLNLVVFGYLIQLIYHDRWLSSSEFIDNNICRWFFIPILHVRVYIYICFDIFSVREYLAYHKVRPVPWSKVCILHFSVKFPLENSHVQWHWNPKLTNYGQKKM